MVNLQDPHRIAWVTLIGEKHRFRGKIARFGHKHRQGSKIKRGATLMLVDVHVIGTQAIVDHAWIEYTAPLAALGEELRPNEIIEFDAYVTTYSKGGKNSKDGSVFDDLQLTNLSAIDYVEKPDFPKGYTPLIGQALVENAIKRRVTVRRGVYIGDDPLGKLGKIYIGQGFANQLAKELSWKWSAVLPKEYQYHG